MNDKNDRTSHDASTKPEAVHGEIVPPKASATQTTSSKRGMNYRKSFIGILIVLFIAFVASYGGIEYFSNTNSNNQVTTLPELKNDGNEVITSQEGNISSVVKKVSPSVVSIVTQSQGVSGFNGRQVGQVGAGSGVIVGKNGYVLTNKHVVDNADTVGVVLADGTSYDKVKVVGTDPLNDIAIVKIPNVDDLPAAELGSSTTIRVGQSVVAIGNSLGQYQNTVTSGIISGTGRPVSAKAGDSVENLTDLLQTDAAINPGNSGGPLLNLQGQVIGINTAVAQDAQGIGFAIPINATKGIIKGVLAGGPVERAYLGLQYTPITADVAAREKLSVKQGAYISGGDNSSAIINNGPADKAGIKENDIITKVNDVEVGSKGGLASLIGEYVPGDTVKLTILRNGDMKTVNVTLEAYKKPN